MPWIERWRFFKTGAEAVAAAVRLARVVTGRDRVLGLRLSRLARLVSGRRGGRCAGGDARALRELPFNDAAGTRALIREAGDQLAAVVVEPLVVVEPTREWLDVVAHGDHAGRRGTGIR